MAGNRLKEGIYREKGDSDDELWSSFNYVFSDACMKTNTYKFVVIKSICDQVYDLKCEDDMYFISYHDLFSRFAEIYWNLLKECKLKQMKNNGKSEYSRVETIIYKYLESYKAIENLTFQTLNNKDKNNLINMVTKDCKEYVIGALYDDFDGQLYAFSKTGDGIYLGRKSHSFISKHKITIERLNYYAWARFLESINSTNDTRGLLSKLDKATPRRTDLSSYRETLLNGIQKKKCFYCDKELKEEIDVDHFIPWSFMRSDNLWNFVLSCPNCNENIKRDFLPTKKHIDIIEQRNNELMDKELYKSEFSNYHCGLITELWNYAKMSGFREMKMPQEK